MIRERESLDSCSLHRACGKPSSRAYPTVSGDVVQQVEAQPEHRRSASCCSSLLLYQSIEEELECCRDALSEEGPPPAGDSQPGRGGPADQRGRTSVLSHPAYDALRYEGTPCGSSASEGRRYRCPAIANPGTLKLANRSTPQVPSNWTRHTQPETEAQIAISPFRPISIPEVIL
jgi:hypothetical protein